jgi:predicted aminopeptidase
VGSLLALLTTTGCGSVGYLAHLGAGQMRLLLDRERLDAERIASLTDEERAGLDAVDAALAYADDLGLAPSKSYRQLIDRGGDPLVTLVVAAPANRLAPVTWWFPIVGSVPYRGYFDPERASDFAAGLAEEGYDTWVRPALAYSTLGWFDDPIPRALLRLPPILLLDTIVHERVHETIFVSGDVAYNEALATFIAHRATLELLAGDASSLERGRALFADELRFALLLERLRLELGTLYEQVESADAAREQRGAIFARYQGPEYDALDWETSRYGGFPTLALSNAWLVAQQTYVGDLPCFERQIAGLGGNLRVFIRLHERDPGRPEACADPEPDAAQAAPDPEDAP